MRKTDRQIDRDLQLMYNNQCVKIYVLTDRQREWQTYIHTDRQTDRLLYLNSYSTNNNQTDRQTYRQSVRHTDRQTDKDRVAEIQTDRQIIIFELLLY